MYALALDQRSAAAELRLAAGDAVVVAADRGRQRAAADVGDDPHRAAPRPVASAAVRPATTLAIGLLLAAILLAGVIALLRI